MRTKYELADVVKQFGIHLGEGTAITALQTKVLNNISQCRTASMGGHEEACDTCGTLRYSYNSCGDRHCPKCQSAKQAMWIENIMQSTLAVKHYHIIFTVPHHLNRICLYDKKKYYELLFSAVWQTLHSFGYTHYGVLSGAIAILHTWGQNLTLHPHVHCIVPAAGYTIDGKWKRIGNKGNYLYPVHQLSESFKAKFIDSLKRSLRKQKALPEFNNQIQQAYKTKWVVHCEPSLARANHVVKYLGQYTHRVAITNQRILNISKGKVTFIAKDYRDNAKKKVLTLDGVEFLRRFTMHILPQRFVKIRRFGIYNHTTKRNLELQFTEPDKSIESEIKKRQTAETKRERLIRLTGIDPCICPACKVGRMVIIRELPRIRSPDILMTKKDKNTANS